MRLRSVTDAAQEMLDTYGDAPYGQTSVNIIDGEWYGIPYMMHGGGQFAAPQRLRECGHRPHDTCHL